MRILRVFPDLKDERLMALFYKGVKAQWASDSVDWTAPIGLSEEQKTALAHVLTPVYLGEQTAMAGAGTILPQMMFAQETEAQLYLGTMLLDEARHFETLTRLYLTMDRRPYELRDLRTMYRYHHRLLQARERHEWVWGILISDLFAKHFYSTFADQFPDTLFGILSKRILVDEARHQAFSQRYLSQAMGSLDEERRRSLLALARDLLDICYELYRHLAPDTVVLGIDGDRILSNLQRDIGRKADKIGLGENVFDDEEEEEGILQAWREEIERRQASGD
ncbi:MAG: hypothetical protein K6V73_04260 [Firmicutes bacterium]|nr:hypothetical protein [Bacillota bacterium]